MKLVISYKSGSPQDTKAFYLTKMYLSFSICVFKENTELMLVIASELKHNELYARIIRNI